MSARQPPYCLSAQRWVRERLNNKSALAPLTGQDFRAFTAFVHLVDLYSAGDDEGRRHAVRAMQHCVSAMQPSTRHLVKVAIPHVMDWSDEERLWSQIADQHVILVGLDGD